MCKRTFYAKIKKNLRVKQSKREVAHEVRKWYFVHCPLQPPEQCPAQRKHAINLCLINSESGTGRIRSQRSDTMARRQEVTVDFNLIEQTFLKNMNELNKVSFWHLAVLCLMGVQIEKQG